MLSLLPGPHRTGKSRVPVFIVPLTVQWWSTWYPGSEPGGGSYIAQRMLAASSERDAMAGTLLFNVAHYALRPWPWIIVALASMLVFPEVADIRRALAARRSALLGHDMAYPAMLTFLPAGVLGLMVAGLLAAYVSTISTHLNWGTSYLVHDLYRRFLRPGPTSGTTCSPAGSSRRALMVAAGLLTLVLDTARTSFDLLLSVGAGTGLLYLLRWFWWRINAWSEIAAMASSFVLALGLFVAERRGRRHPRASLADRHRGDHHRRVARGHVDDRADRSPDAAALLRAGAAGGAGLGGRPPRVWQPGALRRSAGGFVGWVASCVFVYSALFGTGHLLMGHSERGVLSLVIMVISGVTMWRLMARMWAR